MSETNRIRAHFPKSARPASSEVIAQFSGNNRWLRFRAGRYQPKQGTRTMSQSTQPAEPVSRGTLGLTGLTINAMALIAPGAFLWLTFQDRKSTRLNSS